MISRTVLPADGGLRENETPYDIIHRFEKIPTKVYTSDSEAVKAIADKIVAAINDFTQSPVDDYGMEEKTFALGLTTGRTPVGLYHELAERCARGEVSFRRVSVYSLDEFYPITAQEQQSRNYRIHEELVNHIDIKPENVHLIDADLEKADLERYCAIYDKMASKIDLMVVGVGEQGQIGFNDTGVNPKSKTRMVQLSHNTRTVLSSLFFGDGNTPRMGITLGIGTVMKAKQILLMAWGEDKAQAVKDIVEGECSSVVPASLLQEHPNIAVYIDENAASLLTRRQTPWLVGSCDWTPKFVRKAVVWLCEKVGKPILKLTYNDYIQNSLGELLEVRGSYDQINIDVFNDLQHTITGWPGGKPNADDSTRPVSSSPYPKRVIIFSPHPDDDVISMGGTFHRLVKQGHDVHVAYETSGNVAVYDDVVLQNLDTAKELGLGDRYDEVVEIIKNKVKGQPEPRPLLDIKGAIRRAEAKAACRSLGLNDRTNCHFLNLPFYETGGIKKGELTEADIEIIIDLLHNVKPHQVYVAGDLTDPHGTHRLCTEAVFEAMARTADEDWNKECHIWLYRGAWQEWNLGMVDMAVPLSPEEIIAKRHAIYRHLSQKDIVPFPGADKREFWQRAEDRTQNTARLYDALGMAEYQAIEVFVKMR
ncbi:MAG: glucosamine-6-phosphate deaminase [Rikenellaceae bacterium]|nr:glucosamine-6-phosphate deaminase [Rikenellaceae bacterium]